MVQKVRRGMWIWLGKVLLAGVIAFIALTLFCMIYDNFPVHYATADGVTDYHWQPDYLYCRCTEGFSWGRTNNEGYMNAFDYTEDTPVDVLVMGSSHMEAAQVPMGLSTAGRLGGYLPGKTVYNIGVSGHQLVSCAQNLSAAVKKYAPSEYVIVEISSTFFPNDSLRQALAGQLPEIPSHNGGIIGLLQQNQFLRRIYHQLKNFISGEQDEESAEVDAASAEDTNDQTLLSALIAQMADTVSASGAKLIIAYHPSTTLERDGSITFDTTWAEEDAFARLCAENGVYFLSTRDRFQAEYDGEHILPYGFANTSVGTGHLNRYGHEMMAEEIYALMQEVGL